MSENTNPDTRTLLTRDTIKHLAERCDLNRIIGPLSVVNADEWDYLLTFTHRAFDAAGVEQLMRERDEARADVERLKAEVERLTAERDEARGEVERVTRQNSENFAEAECLKNAIDHLTDHLMSERDEAQAEVERLTAERDQTANRPKGREVGRVGLDHAYINAIPPPRPTDEDIWREVFMRHLFDHDIEKLMGAADLALSLYRTRWPR